MLWQESEGVKNKYHLVNWLVVCMANSQWGLVLDLHTVNISLLSKWSWKLENKGGMWQEILMKKYVKFNLSYYKETGGSTFLARFDEC